MSFPRPLTEDERNLVRWMIEHGDAEPEPLLSQLAQAQVISECSCGCASIDFKIEGHPVSPGGGMEIISDYLYGPESPPFGAFVFKRNGLLAGLEVYSYTDPAPLPRPEELRSFGEPET